MTEARYDIESVPTLVDGHPVRWADGTCPHGERFAIRVSEDHAYADSQKGIWRFTDLGNGRCRIEPSVKWMGGSGNHRDDWCHFGPGEFPFAWKESAP